MTDDTSAPWRDSVKAQERAQDLLDAGQDILKHGNTLFNDVHDLEAFLAAVMAVTAATRALAEFIQIVRAHDAETSFPPKVRLAAFQRAGGVCEASGCKTKLRPGDLYYDHIIPDALGGEPTLDNCQCLCKSHHDPKTAAEDVPRIAKMKRQHRAFIGAKAKRPWPKRSFR